MGLPEALISTLGNLISALAELVAVISGDIKMVLKPAEVHRALGSSVISNTNQTSDSVPQQNNNNDNSEAQQNIYANPDIYLTVPQLIVKYGYPFEEHKVVTDDKYILSVFRIPHGRRGPNVSKRRPPVLMVHGLFNSGGAWIMHHPEKALAYMLADNGYDCWLLNCRGSTYSRAHETLSPETDKEFWDFSFHEVGKLDIPAVINYILEETGRSNLYYIGHSLGNNKLMIAMSENPQITEKIKLFISFAPACYLYRTTSKLLKLPAPFCFQQKAVLDYLTGSGEFMPKTLIQSFKDFSSFIPNPEYLSTKCVTASMYTMGGYNPEQIYWPQLPVVAGHTPCSTSVRTYIHCLQYFNNSEFQQYDYGSIEANRKVYKQDKIPKYDLTRVTSPVAIFWGANDLLCRPETVGRLASELPNVILCQRVNCDQFSHTDFLYAKDVDRLLYNQVLELMETYL